MIKIINMIINKLLFLIGMLGLIITGLLSFKAIENVVIEIGKELEKNKRGKNND